MTPSMTTSQIPLELSLGNDTEVLVLRALQTNYIHVVHKKGRSGCVVIDPGDADVIEQVLVDRDFSLEGILITHPHADHVGGLPALLARRSCPIYCSDIDLPVVQHAAKAAHEGELVPVAGLNFEAISIPGHTRGHVAWYLRSVGALFVGDTLFAFGCGRIFDGSAESLYASLKKLSHLPLNTRLFFGHEYAEPNAAFAREIEPENPMIPARLEKIRSELRQSGYSSPPTLADELATNPFLRTEEPAIKRHLGQERASPIEVFAQMRALKDTFKA